MADGKGPESQPAPQNTIGVSCTLVRISRTGWTRREERHCTPSSGLELKNVAT